jgi:hypothetical protein
MKHRYQIYQINYGFGNIYSQITNFNSISLTLSCLLADILLCLLTSDIIPSTIWPDPDTVLVTITIVWLVRAPVGEADRRHVESNRVQPASQSEAAVLVVVEVVVSGSNCCAQDCVGHLA